MSLPQMQGPSFIWALMKIGIEAKEAITGMYRIFFSFLVFATLTSTSTVQAQVANWEPQRSQIANWGTILAEPFERTAIVRGSSHLAIPVYQIEKVGHSSLDVQFGERHTFAVNSTEQDYFRQASIFANVNIRKVYKYGLIRTGYQAITTRRMNNQFVTNAQPFAEGWFGNWSQKYPGSAWLYITKEQFGEGVVGRGAYQQTYNFIALPNQKTTIGINGMVYGSYGEFSRNAWNRQIGVAVGPRTHTFIGNGVVIGLLEYTVAWRPDGRRDDIVRYGLMYWFGKNMKSW